MSWIHCTNLACEGGCKDDYDVEGGEMHGWSMQGVERQPTGGTNENHNETRLSVL